MNKARSIKQNDRPDGLPDFRNLGTLLRILLITNAIALLQAFMMADSWPDAAQRAVQIDMLLAPVLFATLALFWAVQPWLGKLSYFHGVLAVTVSVVVLTLSIRHIGGDLYRPPDRSESLYDVMRYAVLSAIESGILLLYFHVRAKVLSRALNDARLQVLRARIRPHFLFNTINAVLGIVRTRPDQAETALEDMSDLFRMAMSDVHDLAPLEHEIRLSEQYLALEQLRMGERLRVDWQIGEAPDDAQIPPLLLQPLLENAVYHGIESLPQGGTIKIVLRRNGDELFLQVENPCAPRVASGHSGNMVALGNIRERLDLLFDVEARYLVEKGEDFYRVEITFPYVPRVKETS